MLSFCQGVDVVDIEPLGTVRPNSSQPGRRWLDPLVIVALFAFGLADRLVAARRLSFHVDELFSLLGARMVAERGVPLLPSGVPYLHGATLCRTLGWTADTGRMNQARVIRNPAQHGPGDGG